MVFFVGSDIALPLRWFRFVVLLRCYYIQIEENGGEANASEDDSAYEDDDDDDDDNDGSSDNEVAAYKDRTGVSYKAEEELNNGLKYEKAVATTAKEEESKLVCDGTVAGLKNPVQCEL